MKYTDYIKAASLLATIKSAGAYDPRMFDYGGTTLGGPVGAAFLGAGRNEDNPAMGALRGAAGSLGGGLLGILGGAGLGIGVGALTGADKKIQGLLGGLGGTLGGMVGMAEGSRASINKKDKKKDKGKDDKKDDEKDKKEDSDKEASFGYTETFRKIATLQPLFDAAAYVEQERTKEAMMKGFAAGVGRAVRRGGAMLRKRQSPTLQNIGKSIHGRADKFVQSNRKAFNDSYGAADAKITPPDPNKLTGATFPDAAKQKSVRDNFMRAEQFGSRYGMPILGAGAVGGVAGLGGGAHVAGRYMGGNSAVNDFQDMGALERLMMAINPEGYDDGGGFGRFVANVATLGGYGKGRSNVRNQYDNLNMMQRLGLAVNPGRLG